MSRLDEFLRLLCGRFDNTRQLEELRRRLQELGEKMNISIHIQREEIVDAMHRI